MKICLKTLMAAMCILYVPFACAQHQIDTVLKEQTAGIEAPFNDIAFESYLRTLPVVTTKNGIRLYVIEGDILRTRDEVRIYLSNLKNREAEKKTPGELIVNLQNDVVDYWDSLLSRQLTYYIDKSSFGSPADYELVAKNMQLATTDWEQACAQCGILFKHVSELDEKPNQDKVTFVISQYDSNGKYIAASFFPSDPTFRRNLYVDPSYFVTTFDMIGVLRHEIGHILGYRHEHTRDVPGCYFEDHKWKPLTPYDPHSVMHYFCGNAGSMDLALTKSDVEGHKNLYLSKTDTRKPTLDSSQGGAQGESPSNNTLVVRFEGGKVSENLVDAAMTFIGAGIIFTDEYVIKQGDTLCSIYANSLSFPSRLKCPESHVRRLAEQLNNSNKFSHPKILTPGATIKVPKDFFLKTYSYSKIYDLRTLDTEMRMKHDRVAWNATNNTTDAKKNTEITFEGYEIRLPVTATNELRDVQTKLASPNVYLNLVPSTLSPSPLHAIDLSPTDHVELCRNSESETGEGSYLLMFRQRAGVGAAKLPQCAKKCSGAHCAQIIMIDTPVYMNDDIRTAIKYPSFSPQIANPTDESGQRLCLETSFKVKEHHATHLAGIMVSQENGYGFIGLSPGAELFSYNYSDLSDDQLADLIQEKMDRSDYPSRKVFLFASNFRAYPPGTVDDQVFRMINPKDRFDKKLAAKRIRDLAPLWVSAVGQPGENSSAKIPTEIMREVPLSPMNLGDLPNVIIVTVCDDCTDKNAHLSTDANFSIGQRMVHIAAPGKDVAGWANQTQMTVAKGGTSQAAAIVAGVAASMMNCYGSYYSDAATVRQRLMLTARPVFDDSDAPKVRSGIVDVNMALLDPTKTWLKRVGESEVSAVDVKNWCVPAIHLSDPATNQTLDNSYFDASDIRGISVYARDDDDSPRRWVVTAAVGVGDIRHSPPGVWNPEGKLLRLVNDQVVTLNQIEYLLLAKSAGHGGCQ
jgi:hypothetical protein